jgi:hypothetical protein
MGVVQTKPMALTIKTSTTEGPYRPVQRTSVVFSLTSLLACVREASEDRTNAIAVYNDNEPVAIWIREPDFDCDAEGYHEIEAGHPFEVYRRYNKLDLDNHQFRHHISYYFGVQFK